MISDSVISDQRLRAGDCYSTDSEDYGDCTDYRLVPAISMSHTHRRNRERHHERERDRSSSADDPETPETVGK